MDAVGRVDLYPGSIAVIHHPLETDRVDVEKECFSCEPRIYECSPRSIGRSVRNAFVEEEGRFSRAQEQQSSLKEEVIALGDTWWRLTQRKRSLRHHGTRQRTPQLHGSTNIWCADAGGTEKGCEN